uniref:CBS domain-containing protein n=1 Tax=Setaria digitata TaxID=48799 RepID=A0A915PND7_9BILA
MRCDAIFSFLSGLRVLVGRTRSDSMDNNENTRIPWPPINKPLRRVQIECCPVESVYDLREDSESHDLYDDARAFRRPRSNSSDFLILRKTSRPVSVDVVGLLDDNLDPYKQYMKVVDCYELAPHAARVILVDSKVKLQKAFKVLIEWDVGSVVVWCSRQERITAVLSLTDFLVSLLSQTSEESTTVEETVSANQLVRLEGSCKLLEACHEFCSNRVHRIVISSDQAGDVLYLLTIKRILQAVHKQNRSLHFASWLDWDIKKSKIGTWNNLQTVHEKDNLERVARKMLDYRISSLPIIDDEDRPVDVICKTDIAYALADAKNFKKLTAVEAVRNRQPVIFLSETDTVNRILDFALSQKDCRCVFVISPESRRLTGAISLSDFISHILYSDLRSNITTD